MDHSTAEPSKTAPSLNLALEKGIMAAIFLLALSLRLWDLQKNGFCNTYYAATVRSMTMSWHNFFFDSFDPTGYVTVDKPPVALWFQAAFAKLFGYKAVILILPQILEGLCSIGLVYHLVRRRFDSWAALLAALALALCPISVAVDRYNNTDGCLAMILLLAACFMARAAEGGKLKLLLAAMVLVGIGFNTKMVVAFIVLPSFYLLYFLGAPGDLKKRLRDLTLASLVVAVAALAWPLTFDLTPATKRPFAGSTQDGSMISLSLGWNGFQRLIRNRGRDRFPVPAVTPTVTSSSGTPNAPSAVITPNQPAMNNQAGAPPQFRGQGRRGGQNQNHIAMWINTGVPGLFRLADPNMAGQVLWFFPLCLIGLFVQARKSKKNLPLLQNHQSLFMWGGWLLTYALVFSFMQAGVHTYYLVMLAAPLAALTGIGVRALWLDFTQNNSSRLLPLSLLLAGVWQAYIISDYPDWGAWLIPCLLIGLAVALICLSSVGNSAKARTGPLAWEKRSLALALLALFLSPFAWALTPILGNRGSVEANPNLISGDDTGRGMFGGGQNNMNNDKLIQFLEANHQEEKYLLAAQNSMAVSPLIIKYGVPVIALGGFGGRDATCTVDQFAQMVKAGQIRYFLLGGDRGNGFGRPGAPPMGRIANANNANAGGGWGGGGWGNQGGFQADISKWVRENGKPVEPKLWRIVNPREAETPNPALAGNFNDNGGFGRRQGGGQQLYDLRPDKQPKTASKN